MGNYDEREERGNSEAHTGWGVGLQGRDDSWLGDLVGATVLHINRGQQKHIALLSDTRGNRLHDLPIDRLLVIRNKILVQEFLDLIRG